MRGLRDLDARLHRRVADASLEAFDALVDLAVDRDAAFLVIAGDVYDGADRGARAQLRVLAGARRLDERGIRLLVAHGNHDPLEQGWNGIDRWPDNVTVFRVDEPEHVEVHRDDELLAVVTGVSYRERAESRNLALRFTRTAAPVPHVAVLHANVGGNPDHDPYAPASIGDLERTGHDYWALGHIHQRQTLARPAADGTGAWIQYAGNLQGRSPKASEQGEKGALVVHCRNGRFDEPEFVALDRVRFAEITVELDDHSDLGSVAEDLASRVDRAVDAAHGRLVLLRGVVTGAGPLHLELRRDGRLEELREALGDLLPPGEVAAWTSLRDRTRPPVAPADVAPAIDVLDGLDVDLDALVAAVDEVASQLRVAPPPGDELVAEARALALGLLHGQDT